MIVLGWLYSHFGGRHFGAWLYCVYCFARYLDFAWRAFAAHSLDAQAKLFSLAVVGGLACELLHHSATLEPAARRAPQGCFKKDGVAFSQRREMDARGRPTHELHIRVRTRRSE
jgi:hypothetical protein